MLLARLRMVGREDDTIAYNMMRLNTLYIMTICTEIIAPVISTFLLDENCFRWVGSIRVKL